MAIFGVAFSPLQVSVGMQVTEGVLTQEYNPDTSEYMPDRRIRPTAVLPVVTVKDPSGLIEDGVANHLLADIYWYEGEISDAKAILDSNQNYKIDRTSDNANRGRITVYKNIPFNNPLTLAFKATLVDMSGGKVRRKTPVAGSVVLSTSTAAVSPVVLIQGYPRGNFYNILDTMKHLKLSAKLMAGTEEVPSAMWWYRKEGAKLTEITDYVGAKTGELQVPVADIGRLSKYVVKAQDCRKDLQALRDEWLDDELEKIRDYPRNLIAKQYLMDWNEVQAGITTKGEDADGEYWKINTIYLRQYVAKSSDNDIFQGKIDYQPNVRYSLKVKWRTDADYNFFPFAFLFKYTDGTDSSYNLTISNNHGELVEDTFVVPDGKSLERISMTLENSGYVRIYDLQLTELYDESDFPSAPEWIPSADDLAAEAEQVQLPAEYRPATQGETEDGEYDLGMRMPNYTTRVVTPWGDDKEVVMIPPGVKLFPAWIQVDTPQGTLEEPEKYFSADWGNGLKGMQVLLDAEQIGTGTMVVEPEVHEDLSMARYRCSGGKNVLIASCDSTQLEDFEEGTKIVIEWKKYDYSIGSQVFYCTKSTSGVIFTKSNIGLNVVVDGKYRGIKTGSFSRIEVVLSAEYLNTGITVDGIPVNNSDWIDASLSLSDGLSFYDGICLAEIYSPDGTLLHRWDFEGSTDEERLADKAATDNPINLTKESGFKLTPI